MTRNDFLKKAGLAIVSLAVIGVSGLLSNKDNSKSCSSKKVASSKEKTKVGLFENFKRYSAVIKEKNKTLPENINRY
ncbi:MAG: hypothetical protein HY279_03855 [Nitrospinae bacterium]|nr:hypothetical protein [Nitrospinota bacterium]